MSASEHRELLSEIASHFEVLAMQIEEMLEALAEDQSGTVILADLHRAKDAARQGAKATRSAFSNVRCAFD